MVSLLSLAPPPPPRCAGDEDTLSRRRPRATWRSLLYRLLFRFLVATARRFTGPPPPSRSLGLSVTRRRIRPVPTPSFSLERRTGARRHAAGSWNARCGAPRTNTHGPLLCAVAPLRGVARLEWRDWPAPPPASPGWSDRGGARGTFVTRRISPGRPGARLGAAKGSALAGVVFLFFLPLRVRPTSSRVVSRGVLRCAAPARELAVSVANPPSRWRLVRAGKTSLWCMAR